MRFAIIAALLLTPAAAQAQHLTKTALSGKPLKLNFSNAINPDCGSVGETVVRRATTTQGATRRSGEGGVEASATRGVSLLRRSRPQFSHWKMCSRLE